MLALTFQIGADRVAVDVRRVREVLPRVRLTPALGGPAWMAGAFVYRGRVVPVVDLHRLTGAGECPPHLSSRIILVPFPPESDQLVGLLATQVADVRELSVPAPDQGIRSGGWLGPPAADGTGIIRVIDPNRLLTSIDLTSVVPCPGTGP